MVLVLHPHELAVLEALKGTGSMPFERMEKELGIDSGSLRWAIEGLLSAGAISVERRTGTTLELTDEGRSDLEAFPEELLVRELMSVGGSADASSVKNGIGLIWAKRNGWLEIRGGRVTLSQAGRDEASGTKQYAQRSVLKSISDTGVLGAQGSDAVVDALVRRKLVERKTRNVIDSVSITEAGLKLLSEQRPGSGAEIGALTRELIGNRGWAGRRFRSYDVNAGVEQGSPARLHPIHELISAIRRIWLEMGFTEVSGPVIESALWNFDALFSPQDHPTRDMQDTFFLANPKSIGIEDAKLLGRVRSMHTKAWGKPWRLAAAERALLRTHTTSVSARHVRKFANEPGSSYPIKLFSIGRIFRNESIDYKHLAELHQIDGIVIGDNLTLANLIDILTKFYAGLGIRPSFKPSYFPFVEPGVEVYYHDDKRGDIELCGAGVLRREIARAMGTRKSVLAWGIGIERLMFNLLDISSLSELYRNDVDWLRSRADTSL